MTISNQTKSLALKVSLEIKVQRTGKMYCSPYCSRVAIKVLDFALDNHIKASELFSILKNIETGAEIDYHKGLTILIILQDEVNTLKYKYPVSYA